MPKNRRFYTASTPRRKKEKNAVGKIAHAIRSPKYPINATPEFVSEKTAVPDTANQEVMSC